MRTHLLVIAAVVFASSCNNSCQMVCVRMSAYAEECGFTVPESQVDACVDAWEGSEAKESRPLCRDFGSAEAIRKEWSCDELQAYFAGDADAQE
jgi:hypothetical protein